MGFSQNTCFLCRAGPRLTPPPGVLREAASRRMRYGRSKPAAMNGAYQRYFPEPFPALPFRPRVPPDDAQAEIEAVAVLLS